MCRVDSLPEADIILCALCLFVSPEEASVVLTQSLTACHRATSSQTVTIAKEKILESSPKEMSSFHTESIMNKGNGCKTQATTVLQKKNWLTEVSGSSNPGGLFVSSFVFISFSNEFVSTFSCLFLFISLFLHILFFLSSIFYCFHASI